MNEDRAFLWIVSDGRFIDEAAHSAIQVARTMPEIPRFLFSLNNSVSGNSFTHFYGMAKKYDVWYLQSTWMMVEALKWFDRYGIRRIVYMDADTYMIDPVYELFDLPYLFNFSGTRAPGRKTTAHIESHFPSSLFPEYNIGVNPMYVPSAINLWETALRVYERHADQYGDNDQGALRDALIAHVVNDENFRIYTMPQEYNCRFIMPMFLNGRVKILHGRNPDMEKIAHDINEREGMRLWQPYQLL